MKSFLAGLCILLSQAVVNAAPLEARAVSQSLYNQLSLYEQWSAAAYGASNNNGAAGSPIICIAGNCPLVQSAGAKSVVEFQNQGLVDATGFVAVDKTRKQIVIAYRGSHSVVNFLADAQAVQLPYLCAGCFIHAGFLSSWLATKTSVINAVNSALAANPGYSIYATGHSLGAAIATIAAAELRTKGYTVGLYNYGSPMVGNSFFASFVTNQPGGNYRVTHQSDLVPKLPGYLFLDYRHIAPEYWIISGDNVTPTPNDIQVINAGILDLAGNEGTLNPSISNHLWYFNSVAGSAPDGLELTK